MIHAELHDETSLMEPFAILMLSLILVAGSAWWILRK